MTMGDLEQARQLFADAGLAFPTIPARLAVKLKKRDHWLFSTRALKESPYNLHYYVQESERTRTREYAVICHSGHSTNSYAIQYYLVYGPVRLFLHLGWGGVYMDADAAAAQIKKCFALADRIVPLALSAGRLPAGERLTIVGSDFCGSHWLMSAQSPQEEGRGSRCPAKVLAEVLRWLKDPTPN
jgi:hypothetical protein